MRHALLFSISLFAVSSVASSDPTYELWYSVSAQVRSLRADADIEAGGRLRMRGSPTSAGGLQLELLSVLEDPWKFYWVDPAGPLGEETKLAAVATLPEASWAELDAARDRIAQLGSLKHARWLKASARRAKLDGTFAFVVIGPLEGRFRVEIGPRGSVSAVVNRMTDRWLPGPFDQFVEKDPPTGYWFWNEGEPRPFEWEPRTYKALEAALDLLSVSLPEGSETGEHAVIRWPDLGKQVTRILGTLAPRTSGRFGDIDGVETAVQVERGPGGRRRLLAKFESNDPQLVLERETVFSSEGAHASDRVRIRLAPNLRQGGHLEIEVGYAREETE